MPKNTSIKKVLVIGSGPIVIGQAAEFDYAGTQACRSLKEEGIHVVLVNSNPATIMTDKDIADEVYIEPLTPEVIKKLILKVSPDSLLPTLGGQAALNIAMELDECGFLKEHKVKLIGTTGKTIRKAEDREEFKETMEKIGEPIAPSQIVTNVEDGLEYAQKIGYPVVLRPAYTLGGSGGGIAHNETELIDILSNGLRLSRVGEVLVERCIAGWKEIEYEVMRDANGNCITVCNMENIDPVGVKEGSKSQHAQQCSLCPCQDVALPAVSYPDVLPDGVDQHRKEQQFQMFPRTFADRGIQSHDPIFSCPAVQKMEHCPKDNAP